MSMFLVLLVSALLYFIPTIVAYARKHRQILAIFCLNFFLGWTFVGWVAALIWALVRSQPATQATVAPAPPTA